MPDVYPTPETAAIRPQYPYALTKYLGELIALHWAQVYHLPVVSLRLFNVYGPTEGAITAAFAELVGGVLVLLGLFTRLGAFLITCVMLTAIFGVLWPKFFAPEGMELAVAFLGMALALLIMGGGQASADRMIGRRR